MRDLKWKKVVYEELDALKQNQTWDKVVLPPRKRTVG